MSNRTAAFFRSDLGLLVLLAALRLAVHIATNGQYGFHRDELQTLDDARHLDWGFVVYPPVTPLIGRFELFLFGTSLAGFRLFSAIAVSTVMVLAGLIAKELGGTRHVNCLRLWLRESPQFHSHKARYFNMCRSTIFGVSRLPIFSCDC